MIIRVISLMKTSCGKCLVLLFKYYIHIYFFKFCLRIRTSGRIVELIDVVCPPDNRKVIKVGQSYRTQSVQNYSVVSHNMINYNYREIMNIKEKNNSRYLFVFALDIHMFLVRVQVVLQRILVFLGN